MNYTYYPLSLPPRRRILPCSLKPFFFFRSEHYANYILHLSISLSIVGWNVFSNLNANCERNHFKLSICLKYDWNKDFGCVALIWAKWIDLKSIKSSAREGKDAFDVWRCLGEGLKVFREVCKPYDIACCPMSEPVKGHCFISLLESFASLIMRNDELNCHSTLYQRVFDWIIAYTFRSPLASSLLRLAFNRSREEKEKKKNLLSESFKSDCYFHFMTDKSLSYRFHPLHRNGSWRGWQRG